mmetsp:Transcript_3066/g.8894  ORF Transcript_3066/g.8894 Transcript_3066/m.8894 type:complete len:84 (-) Transcript_3066:438-689(-)
MCHHGEVLRFMAQWSVSGSASSHSVSRLRGRLFAPALWGGWVRSEFGREWRTCVNLCRRLSTDGAAPGAPPDVFRVDINEVGI